MFKKLFNKMFIDKIHMTFLYCPFCGSLQTGHSNLKQEKIDICAIDNYDIQCNVCGAKGEVREIWRK